MKQFFSVYDVPNLSALIDDAMRIKANPYEHETLGKRKTLGLLFFNPSLRTRMSSQKAAQNLGMHCMVLNAGTESWKIEVADGAVMNYDTVEHIKEGAGVLGEYCDIIGVRAFAGLQDREKDYAEEVLHKIKQYSGRPVISLEGATRHPLQSLADTITIKEIQAKEQLSHKPKVVLTWVPHPKPIPQAVANSFAEWMNALAKRDEVEFVITHPWGYELAPDFVGNARVIYDQNEALKDADFVYAKNWSSYTDYGKVLLQDYTWTITNKKMALTNNGKFMHCLPTRRNVEVADEVLDGPQSVVIQEAANRVVAAQTVLKSMLEAHV